MNRKILRGAMALLLSLALLISLLAGLTLTASADTYAYNSGVRGETCSALSAAALSYWSGDYTYAALNAQTGDTLRNTLHTKIFSNRTTGDYNGLITGFPYTDCYQGDTSKVLLFYSCVSSSSDWVPSSYWNREHIWPQSLGGRLVEGDLHSMRPTDPTANSTRGNRQYANVRALYPSTYKTAKTNATNGSVDAGYYYSNTYFEPLDAVKGDVARILLYDYVAELTMDAPTIVFKDIDTLLAWNAADPVDTYEMQRNDIIESIQGCRNPFVDYPELAWRIYDSYEMPYGFMTPSGSAAFVITPSTNNSARGTATVSGYTLTAHPAEGYYASSYTVMSGTATVVQDGNTFKVAPSSNCTIRVNFSQKKAVTVTLSANGTTTTQNGYSGNVMNLPTPTAPTGYRFIGWVPTQVAATTNRPATIYSGSFTPAGDNTNITLYALYGESSGGEGDYVKVTSAPTSWAGDYVIVYEDGGLIFDGSLTTLDANNNYQSVTITNNTISAAQGDPYKFTIEGSDGEYTIRSVSGYYIGNTSDSNALSASTSTEYTNSISLTDGSVDIESSGGAYLRFNSASNTMRFRYYRSGSYTGQKAIQLYAKDETSATTTYTTSPACVHNYTSAVTTAATCTAAGVTTYTCTLCGDTYTQAAPAALGHSYGAFTSNNNGTHSKTCSRCADVVTESCTYTSSTSGTAITYTCSVCNYSYQEAAPTYTVTYNDRGSTTSVTCAQGGSVTLPATASTVSGYTFAGWVAAAIATETTAAPTVLTGAYTPSGNITLYACYTRTQSGGTASLVRMTAGNTLANGDKIVIVADGTDVALYQETVSSSYVNKYTFDSSAATVLADEKNYLTVNVNNDGFTLGDATNGYLNSNNNYLYCNSTEQTWTLSDLGDGTFKLQSDGRNLSYRSDLTSQYWRMGGTNYGTSGNTVLRLYKVTGGAAGTAYYTTAPTAVAPTTYTVTYNDRGSTTTATCTAGNSVTLPASASTVSGYTFTGWVAAAIGTETSTAPTVLTGSYTPSGNLTLYACYVRSEGGSSAGYALASGTLAADDQVIVALKNGDDYYALPNANSAGVSGKAGIALTVTDGIAAAASTYTFVIYEGSGHLALKSSEAANYIGLNSSGKISCNGWGDTKYLIFTEVGGGLYTITSETTAGRGLVVDGTSFKANDSSADNVYIFKYTAGGSATTYYTTSPVAAGLSFVSAAPILKQKIDLVYTVSVPSGYENPYMTFTFNGSTTTVTDYVTENGNLKFTFTGINPQCMGDTVTATLYATKSGATESVSNASYSVRQYCVNKLADSTISASLRKLLSDLLAYGAAAQTYVGYKTNALVTAGNDITNPSYSAFSALSGNTAGFSGTANANYYWISAGLTLTDSAAMTFRFYAASTTGLVVKVTFDGETTSISPSSFTTVSENVYEVTFAGISADDFAKNATVGLYRGTSLNGQSLTYSVNTYVQSKQNDSNANLKALVRALYNYGASAAAYAG